MTLDLVETFVLILFYQSITNNTDELVNYSQLTTLIRIKWIKNLCEQMNAIFPNFYQIMRFSSANISAWCGVTWLASASKILLFPLVYLLPTLKDFFRLLHDQKISTTCQKTIIRYVQSSNTISFLCCFSIKMFSLKFVRMNKIF